jgi:type IV pilus assembly protein PilW
MIMPTPSFLQANRLGIRRGTFPAQSANGFTLIEVMVSLMLGLFLLLGVTYVYVGSKQTYRSVSSLSRMQESGRLAFEYLTQDLRMAGYYGCATSSFKSDSDYQYYGQPTANTCPSGTPPLSGKLVNTLKNPGSFGSNYRSAIDGYNGKTAVSDPPATTSTFDPSLPTGTWPTTGDGRALNNSDILVVTGALPLGITISAHTTSTGNITIPALPAGLKSLKATANTNAIVAADCQGAGVFFITNTLTTGTTTLSHATGGSNKNQCDDLGKTFVGGEILKAFTRAYYIAVDSTTNQRTLYRREVDGTDQALVPGIENMQIKYGLAASLEEYPVDYYTAEEVMTHACNIAKTGGASTGDVWDCVKSIRVDLLLVSPDENLTSAAQTLWFDGSDFTPTDNRLRFVMTATIGVRNRLLQSTE